VVAQYRREEDVTDGTTSAPPDAVAVVLQLQAMPQVRD
jgi:hypothetical protein